MKDSIWGRASTNTTSIRRYYNDNFKNILKAPISNSLKTEKGIYCNILSETTAELNYRKVQGIASDTDGRIYTYIDSLSESDITALIDLFTSTNAYMLVPLATPSKTEITDTTLINQLDEIYKLLSNNGTTIIETECEEGNIPIIIKAKALLDSEKKLHDLETRIERLESEE